MDELAAPAVWRKTADLLKQAWAQNPRKNAAAVRPVAESIREFGFASVLICRAEDGELIAGHTRVLAAAEVGLDQLPVRFMDLDQRKAHLLALADNRLGELADWDRELLAALLGEFNEEEALLAGFDMEYLADLDAELAGLQRELEAELEAEQPKKGTLAERWVVPPFTVLDARSTNWGQRRRAWADCGVPLDSLDPVLAEVAVRWFSAAGGRVLEPLATTPTLGMVASALGREFDGLDASPWSHLAAFAKATLPQGPAPQWHTFESMMDLDPADLLLTQPPAQTVSWRDYRALYAEIITGAAAQLADDRFAVVVVEDYREKRTGLCRDMVGATVRSCERAGLSLYNEAILVQRVGTAAWRSHRQFAPARKLVRLHQTVLVFVKGNWRRACAYANQPQPPEVQRAPGDAEPADALP